ncbi:nitroreductase family deazaflavin-dependent oxidoreductase [Mycolicibacter terrae]|uniref:Nitroreductase n=2 Tax=Mycolicibacter TaxID=1073531 RepID=A0A1A2Y6X4_MYCSD|nr:MULTISPECIES: nitroreductase family deazaflavin-dependent oxidoreductase [Mycolicibacter]OBH19915.1 nitroreductase [Mycolicibacter sinensis]OBI33839.1 nitroreductase [Mycolicibacter sinensis]RRR45524.1 nitroreductase family deazaflavin-dependent oxidoreductase [Mycolicibacter terrae]
MSVLVDTASRLLRSRWLVRAPIWLYRARLGGLLGGRLLMLEHVGRKSGARRHVVLEVVEHPQAHRYIVASGFGDRAQWFRNITANPRVRVYAGSRRPAPATARVLGQHEADRVLGDYIQRHPRTWERFSAVLEQTLGEPVTATDTALPMVELQLDR